MKRIFVSSLIFVVSIAYSQEKIITPPTSAMSPKIGEPINVTYNLSKLNNVSELTCEALVDRDDLEPLLIETPMKKDGDVWKCSFSLDDSKSRFIVLRYVSGEQKDDNDGNPMSVVVYGKNNKPAMGAHLAFGNFYLTGRYGDFRRSVDLKQSKIEFEKEKKYYPNSWRATVGLWNVALKESNSIETKNKIKKDLEGFYIKNKTDEDACATVISLYERLEDTVRANIIREEAIERNPKGEIAQSKQSMELRKEQDNLKRAELIKKLVDDFPSMDKRYRESYTQSLVYSYIRAKEYDRASDILATMNKPDAGMYNSIAWPLIDKGESLEKAVSWAKAGIDVAKNLTITDKPSSMRKKDWEENNKYTLAMILDTYGTGLLKLSKNDEALNAFSEAYAKSDATDPDMNTHYVDALLKNKKYDKTIEIGFGCIKKGKDSPGMVNLIKEAFAKSIESSKVFDSLNINEQNKFNSMMADVQKAKIEEMQKKLRESRISMPSIDFTLKDLSGTPLTLSSLKGKIVIVDFWATWCGPCKQSFPYLQKVYEKYQNNPSVKFLAVNSWERQKDYAAQLANAKKFIEDNKYAFTVLIDEKDSDQYKVISDYEVEGIPTKFLIDKKGNIAFKSVGFDGPSMEDELTQQIEMLLAE